MKRVDAIIRSSKFNDVCNALAEHGVPFFTFFEVTGYGKQKGVERTYRGQTYDVSYIKRTKIEVIVSDADVDLVVKTIVDAAKTGEVGDGKIFVSDIDNVYRIRNGDSGTEAL